MTLCVIFCHSIISFIQHRILVARLQIDTGYITPGQFVMFGNDVTGNGLVMVMTMMIKVIYFN